MMSNSPFTSIKEPDIHTIRRVHILKKYPEIKALMRPDSWSGLLTIVIVIVQLFIAYGVGKYWFNIEHWWLFLLVSYFVGAVMNHWVGMAIHEASHDLLLPKPIHNICLSIFANIPILLPVAIPFRKHHLKHHSHLGIEGVDNDFPTHFEADKIGNFRFLKFLWLFFYVFFLTLARGFTEKPNRWEFINVLVILIADCLLVYYWGLGAIAYLLLSTFFGYSLHPVAGHFIHEHFIFEENQETNSYYGVLNLFCFNVGYHNEHHDFMNIPGRFLPQYYQITASFYKDLKASKSWTLMLLQFILSKKMGAYSRYTRDDETRLEGIKRAKKLSKL